MQTHQDRNWIWKCIRLHEALWEKFLKDRLEWIIFIRIKLCVQDTLSQLSSPIYTYLQILDQILALTSRVSREQRPEFCFSCMAVLPTGLPSSILRSTYKWIIQQERMRDSSQGWTELKLGPAYSQKVGIHTQVSAMFASEKRYEFGFSSTQSCVFIITDLLTLVCK